MSPNPSARTKLYLQSRPWSEYDPAPLPHARSRRFPRSQRHAVLTGEHEPVIVVGRSERELLAYLCPAVRAQRADGSGTESDAAATAALRLRQPRWPRAGPKGLHDGRTARVEVQVPPVQAETSPRRIPVLAASRHAAASRSAAVCSRNRVASLASHVRIVGAFASLADGGSAASVGLRTSRLFRTASPRARRRMVCV